MVRFLGSQSMGGGGTPSISPAPRPTSHPGETNAGVWVSQDLLGYPIPQVTNSAKPVCNGCIQAITLDFTMFECLGAWFAPAIGERDLNGRCQLQAPGWWPTEKGVATGTVLCKCCEITWPFITIHCPKDPPHLYLLPMLNCPLNEFLPSCLLIHLTVFQNRNPFYLLIHNCCIKIFFSQTGCT